MNIEYNPYWSHVRRIILTMEYELMPTEFSIKSEDNWYRKSSPSVEIVNPNVLRDEDFFRFVPSNMTEHSS